MNAVIAAIGGAGVAAVALAMFGHRLRRHSLAGFVPLVDVPSGARVPDNGPYAHYFHFHRTLGSACTIGRALRDGDDAEDVCYFKAQADGWASPDDDEITALLAQGPASSEARP